MSLEVQLKTARDDLAAAEGNLAEVLGGEDVAAATNKSYSEWRSAKSDASIEVERLKRLISRLTGDIEAATKVKADQLQADLETDANRTAEATKALIIEKLELMHDAARQMMMAIAASDAKIANATRGRRSDLPPLEGAEARARRGEKLERIVLAQSEFEAWSFLGDRRPLGDEQAERVVGRGNRGQLRSETGPHDVIRRRFREVRFLPEATATFFEPLAEVLSIPPIRAGGVPGWTPVKHAMTPDIHRQLDELAAMEAQPDRRRPQTEIVCLGDAIEPAADTKVA